jgi:predicted lipid-binding transport protein (Tim44 family)
MDTPQFQKAEYGSAASQAACQICKQPVGSTYYRVNGAVACEQCATRMKNATPGSSHANFMRGLLFGIGGAILGLVIYATFTIATGIEIGFISLAVGYIVGKAVKMGSRGFGGAHYQIAAVLLTYAAVSMSAVPIAISYSAKHHSEPPAVRSTGPANPSTSSPGTPSSNSAAGSDSSSESSSGEPRKGGLMLLLYLVYIGLASPFLDLAQDPAHGAIGVIILLVGMRIAWQLTSMSDHAQIVGPFKNESSAAPAAPPPSLG